MLYFDHCATTPPYDEVIDTIGEVMKQFYGNASSLHKFGLEAEKMLNKAREVIALSTGVKPSTIVFTSGGTESNNLAIRGAAIKYRQRGNHLITSRIEHPSVYNVFGQLEKEGFRVTYVSPDEAGIIRVDELLAAITPETSLVSIMHVNNEVGAVQPVERVGELLRGYPKVLFHVDAIQGYGKLELNPARCGIDLMSVSAHKIRGPKGAGFLYKRDGIELQPLFAGGGQEFGLRSGTEDVPSIVAMAKAVRIAAERRSTGTAYLYRLREQLIDRLKSVPELRLSGSSHAADMAPHIVHVTCPGLKPEAFVHALEKRGVAVSTRSACSSDATEPSRVLLAMGYERERAASGIRISLSADHTLDDIQECAAAIVDAFEELRPLIFGHKNGKGCVYK